MVFWCPQVLDPPWVNGRRHSELPGAVCCLPIPLLKPLGFGSRIPNSEQIHSPSPHKFGQGLLKMKQGGKAESSDVQLCEDKGGCPVGLGKGDAPGK